MYNTGNVSQASWCRDACSSHTICMYTACTLV